MLMTHTVPLADACTYFNGILCARYKDQSIEQKLDSYFVELLTPD